MDKMGPFGRRSDAKGGHSASEKPAGTGSRPAGRPLCGGRGERATFTGFYSDLPPHRRLPIAPLTSQLKYALPWGL